MLHHLQKLVEDTGWAFAPQRVPSYGSGRRTFTTVESSFNQLYVGIDWASDHHDIWLTNDSAQTLAAFRIAHGREGFERLHRVINE
jgi:hypothetical protein